MTTRLFASTSLAGIGLALILLSLSTSPHGTALQGSVSARAAAQSLTPTVLAVTPNEAPNNLDTAVTIVGTGFEASPGGTLVLTGPSVSLGGFALPAARWISSTTLTTMVPWGLDAGVYTVTVTNPSGGTGSSPDAFTVTQAIGVWTTGGPYGGQILDLAVSPVTSQTAFAVARGPGLFRTDDGGRTWSLARHDPSAVGVAYGPAPTSTLYQWGGGLWRSDNEGLDWQEVLPEHVEAFALNPQNHQHLWVATPTTVMRSTDGGANWEERNGGLPADAFVMILAVTPASPSILYAGLSNGLVYKTENAGGQWALLDNGLPPASDQFAQTLAVSPFDPDIILYCEWGYQPGLGYRSTDGGDTWAPIAATLGMPGSITDIAFSPHISGTVYASLSGGGWVAVSTDDGATWTSLTTQSGDNMHALGLDPTSGLPAYLGAHAAGTFRSRDGGQTWEHRTDGLAALPILDTAASLNHVGWVYVASEGAGTYVSENAGHTWRKAALDATTLAVAADPDVPERIYAGSREIHRTLDGGRTWQAVTMPYTYDIMVRTIAVAAMSPRIVYAGGLDSDPSERSELHIGVAFRSQDYGANWTELSISQEISTVSDIAIAPSDSQVVYLAAHGRGRVWRWTERPGLGIFRSTDGGDTWQPIVAGIGHVPVSSIAVHPDDPQIVYVGSLRRSDERATVFKSVDGGDSWITTTLLLAWGWVDSLVIDPLAPDTVYAGSEEGLFRSTDGGATWSRAAGGLGNLSIHGLAAASADERTVIYVGTTGGLPAGVARAPLDIASPASQGFVQGGIYQQTIVHRAPDHRIYLPMILRES